MKTILLADDSITIQKVVELTFSEGDYQVICVSNGTEALHKVKEVRPHVALLDIIMPEKNGYEVCAEMKSDPATADIPVLLLTGTFEPFDEKRADAVGAIGHLTKPFESHALVSRVDELIAAGAATRTGPPAAEPVARPAFADPSPLPAVSAAGSDPDVGVERTPDVPPPVLAAPSPYSEDAPSGHAPIGTPPDPEDGGSLQSSAPFDLGAVEEEIIPDRFDDLEDPTSPAGETVRLSRDEVLAAGRNEGDADDHAVPAEATPQAGPMDGFVSGYEMPGPAAAPSPAVRAIEVQGDSAAPDLTQEMVDRIAEQVVQRMSDRAVREIAWEVIPQVAEAIVRNRIKELEEQGEG